MVRRSARIVFRARLLREALIEQPESLNRSTDLRERTQFCWSANTRQRPLEMAEGPRQGRQLPGVPTVVALLGE